MTEKKFPAEFATEWHYERHLEDLARELAGREARLAELKTLDTSQHVLDEVETEIAACRAELDRYTGRKKASKRPAKATETR